MYSFLHNHSRQAHSLSLTVFNPTVAGLRTSGPAIGILPTVSKAKAHVGVHLVQLHLLAQITDKAVIFAQADLGGGIPHTLASLRPQKVGFLQEWHLLRGLVRHEHPLGEVKLQSSHRTQRPPNGLHAATNQHAFDVRFQMGLGNLIPVQNDIFLFVLVCDKHKHLRPHLPGRPATGTKVELQLKPDLLEQRHWVVSPKSFVAAKKRTVSLAEHLGRFGRLLGQHLGIDLVGLHHVLQHDVGAHLEHGGQVSHQTGANTLERVLLQWRAVSLAHLAVERAE